MHAIFSYTRILLKNVWYSSRRRTTALGIHMRWFIYSFHSLDEVIQTSTKIPRGFWSKPKPCIWGTIQKLKVLSRALPPFNFPCILEVMTCKQQRLACLSFMFRYPNSISDINWQIAWKIITSEITPRWYSSSALRCTKKPYEYKRETS
jgi:hypothetical protein